MSVNSTRNSPGRFANHFFRNLLCNLLSINNNIKFNYSYFNEFSELGIDLYQDGIETYTENIDLNETNFFHLVENKIKFNKNIKCEDLQQIYAQNEEFSIYIKKYIYQEEQKNHIIQKNCFNNRYNNNNDLFLHVRMGDAVEYNPGFIYYDAILSNLQFNNGYISSDLIDHPMCTALKNKYKLNIYHDSEVKTIMFGSTCKNIVLSNGTFSWLIGLMGFYSKVYYPKIKKVWHGNIFVFPEWTEIDTSNSIPPLPYNIAKKLLETRSLKYT